MKRILELFGWILLALVVAVLAYIRFAPHDAQRWHTPIEATENRDLEGGAIRVVTAGDGALARADAAARALPRTHAIAGSVEEGRITYVTRSKAIGFPDYTTLEKDGNVLKMFARLRFGRSDFGVNRARLERLLVAAKG